MKQNQRNRFNGRHNQATTNRASKPLLILRNTSLESTGPCGKLRGTALQLAEKYNAAAKNFFVQNDDILGQTCLQYADHYMRLQNIAIANEQMMRTPSKQPSSSAFIEEKAPEVESIASPAVELSDSMDDSILSQPEELTTSFTEDEPSVISQKTERKSGRSRSKKNTDTSSFP